jgi:RHS repeat-associated protein
VDSSGNLFVYFADSLGSSRKIEEVAAGASTATVCYDADFYPFGRENTFTNTCSQNYKFTGKERDSESGLDYFGARYYSSSLGRFMTPDWAAKPTAVPYAHFGNPQSLNLYSCVENNPLSTTDPDGHSPILAMSATAPPQCDLNACSSEMIMYGERGTAGNGIAPPTIAGPAPTAIRRCLPLLAAISLAPTNNGSRTTLLA